MSAIDLRWCDLTPSMIRDINHYFEYEEHERFAPPLLLDHATFNGVIAFEGLRWSKAVTIKNLIAGGSIQFKHCFFDSGLTFQGCTVGSVRVVGGTSRFVEFESVDTSIDCELSGTEIDSWASMLDMNVGRKLELSGLHRSTQDQYEVTLDRVRAGTRLSIENLNDWKIKISESDFAGSIDVDCEKVESLSIIKSNFGERSQIDANAMPNLQLLDTHFRQGVTVSVNEGNLFCVGTRFGPSSSLAGDRFPGAPRNETFQVLSFVGCDVSGLSLSALSLKECVFRGARGLDLLGFASDVSFRSRVTSRFGPSRRIIADESVYRYARNEKGWTSVHWPDSFTFSGTVPGSASEVASVYRALRKSTEAAKDEPGAADLYFGEMEMRRVSSSWRKNFSERLILTCYKFISGYGLRASRSIATLFVLAVVGSVVLHLWGIQATALRTRNFVDTLIFAFQACFSLSSAKDQDVLTAIGRVTQIVLRVIGPVFLGLAFLALRNRVKR